MSAPRPAGSWYGRLLAQAGERHSDLIVIDTGLGTSMQTADFAERFPDRYFNVGIAEQHAVGLASGLARAGYLPLVHSFSNFLTRRAHDQVAVSVVWPGVNVKLIGGSAGLHDGRNGPSHMAIDDLGSMAALPGMMVVEPGDARQAEALFHAMLTSPGPAYFRLSRFGMAADLAPLRDAAAATSLILAAEQPQVTLVACGTMLEKGVEAHGLLAEHGIAAELVHVAVLRPLDAGPILEAVLRSGAAAIVENHVTSSGYGSIVAAALERHGVRIGRFGLPDRFLAAGAEPFQAREAELTGEDIAVRAYELIAGG